MQPSAAGEHPGLIQFWMRAVRVGIVVTILTVLSLAVTLVLPGAEDLRSPFYLAVLVAGALGGALVAVLPWAHLFERGIGLRFLYAWSAADITLISTAIVAARGRVPELFVVYALTTVFFGAAYPPRAQVGLLVFTFAAYLSALVIVGWHVDASALFLQLSMLGILALLTYFLSSDLLRATSSSEHARAEAERWAGMLSSVAESARRMSLDREAVMDASTDAATNLGFEAVAMYALSADGTGCRVVRAAGLGIADGDASRAELPTAGTLPGRVIASGSTVSLTGVEAAHDLDGSMWAGCARIVAVPVWIGGWLGAVLIAGAPGGDLPSHQIEALELLGAQLGLALDNIARFEEEHGMVERLAELDRMKGDFLTTVSHELRTPVTVIKGVGLTLLRSWDSLEAELRTEMIAGLARNAASLEGLISNLLDLSRLDAGAAEVGFDVFDLSDVLRRVADRFEIRFPDHPLERSIPPGLVVEGEPTMIERTVENLISNAGVHTPPATRVELRSTVTSGRARITITDGGPGIPEEVRSRLGERFSRGGSIDVRPKGLGLGLALAREMLELHRSELVVESDAAEGTRVWFELKAVLPAAPRESGWSVSDRPVDADAPRRR